MICWLVTKSSLAITTFPRSLPIQLTQIAPFGTTKRLQKSAPAAESNLLVFPVYLPLMLSDGVRNGSISPYKSQRFVGGVFPVTTRPNSLSLTTLHFKANRLQVLFDLGLQAVGFFEHFSELLGEARHLFLKGLAVILYLGDAYVAAGG